MSQVTICDREGVVHLVALVTTFDIHRGWTSDFYVLTRCNEHVYYDDRREFSATCISCIALGPLPAVTCGEGPACESGIAYADGRFHCFNCGKERAR